MEVDDYLLNLAFPKFQYLEIHRKMSILSLPNIKHMESQFTCDNKNTDLCILESMSGLFCLKE